MQRTLYSQFDRKPDFVTSGESIGYVLECEDTREYFESGELLEFSLVLFGKTIVYFNQFLQALHQLGAYGIGKDRARFKIVSIANTRNQQILEKNNIYMERYQVECVRDYVRQRLAQLGTSEGAVYTMHFMTPLTVKYHGEFVQEFQTEPILLAAMRRIYMLDCFENIDGESYYRKELNIPRRLEQRAFSCSVPRVSFRKNKKMVLKGIRGQMTFTEAFEEEFALLLAGELVHIGKHTSFGFGKYRITK
ncbi:MAG: CRISPR system precrRNA processing endoribonuclease RAMP protein Cas6 [Eubacteriales bacterium]|nr:CRISPR system precrRNA processing endoribonuclease RAMP protein Cas6 [Eubacteriales bacterium]